MHAQQGLSTAVQELSGSREFSGVSLLDRMKLNPFGRSSDGYHLDDSSRSKVFIAKPTPKLPTRRDQLRNPS
jgi:hypothetical protein